MLRRVDKRGCRKIIELGYSPLGLGCREKPRQRGIQSAWVEAGGGVAESSLRFKESKLAARRGPETIKPVPPAAGKFLLVSKQMFLMIRSECMDMSPVSPLYLKTRR